MSSFLAQPASESVPSEQFVWGAHSAFGKRSSRNCVLWEVLGSPGRVRQVRSPSTEKQARSRRERGPVSPTAVMATEPATSADHSVKQGLRPVLPEMPALHGDARENEHPWDVEPAALAFGEGARRRRRKRSVATNTDAFFFTY